MKSIVTVVGPREAGPGERELMLSRARAALEQLGAEDITRVDVPSRGSGDEVSDGGIRGPVQTAIPALQSGSLFGGMTGLLVVDASRWSSPKPKPLHRLWLLQTRPRWPRSSWWPVRFPPRSARR